MILRRGQWTSREVAAAVGGIHRGPDQILEAVGTDSREDLSAALFIALSGPRFDGHDHLAQAAERGAAAALVRVGTKDGVGPQTRIEVADPLTGLRHLAAHHRLRWNGAVLALTGSNGKTSTKELLGVLLGSAGPVLTTEGNLNNRIGAPMTLLGVRSEPLVVLELGMNEPDEIRDLTQMASPDAVMILNIGPAHIGRLGSMEAIARAKGEIFEGAPSAVRVAFHEDARVMGQLRLHPGPAVTFGHDAGADVHIRQRIPLADGSGQRVVLRHGMEEIEWTLPLHGEHQARNLAAAWAGCLALPEGLRPPVGGAVAAVAAMGGLAGRGRTELLGGVTVVDESYNANRASVEAAMAATAERAERSGGRFGVLLGAMNELEGFEEEEHGSVGREAGRWGAQFFAGFGPEGSGIRAAVAAAQEAGVESHHSPDEDETWAFVKPRLRPGLFWLVKGSRSTRTERFIERWRASCST